MAYTIFKSNKRVTGVLASFNFGPTNARNDKGKDSLYINLILQDSWNDSSNSGSFRANAAPDSPNNTTVKLSMEEAGEMLDKIKKVLGYKKEDKAAVNSENEDDFDRKFFHCKFFHKTQNDNSIIRFGPNKISGNYPIGFWFSVSKQVGSERKNFRLPITLGEAQILAVNIESAMVNMWLREDEMRKFNGGEQGSSQPRQERAIQPPEPKDEDAFADAPKSVDDYGDGDEDSPF